MSELTFETPEEALAHFGVKGMKWGVHRQERLERLQRVQSGNASVGDKLKTGALDVALGSKKSQVGAQIRAAENLKTSIEKGEHVTGAVLKYYGTRTMPQVAALTFNRKGAPAKVSISSKDSAVTKRVKNDYNNMTQKEFFGKYASSKKTYAKRVEKYGDPYKKSPLAKAGKKLEKSSFGNTAQKRVDNRNLKKYGTTG